MLALGRRYQRMLVASEFHGECFLGIHVGGTSKRLLCILIVARPAPFCGVPTMVPSPAHSSIIRLLVLGGVLGLSGASGLIYQTTWFREFRLVFGGSTAATGVVLAIFMAGLGVGNWIFGRWAEGVERPLSRYAWLELAVGATAVASGPLLDWLVPVYLATGGQAELGLYGATGVRCLLAAAVLAVPTVLMGGTLPLAARIVTGVEDGPRRGVSLLYACNTAGAMIGVLLSTFWSLEAIGNRGTMLLGAASNLLAAALAAVGGRLGLEVCGVQGETNTSADPRPTFAVKLAAASAGVTGLTFFLMELVWFRMLSPILGGTTFTFGVILAVILAGIAVGGSLYTFASHRVPMTATLFAVSNAIMALAVAAPFWAGDSLAIWTAGMLDRDRESFGRLTGVWFLVTAIVVFMPSVMSGLQFPLLIGLVGRGPSGVSRQVGWLIACNTAGAIVGSLLGGLGVMPALGVLGTWRIVVTILVMLSTVAWLIGSVQRGVRLGQAALLLVCLAPLGIWWAEGPTAVWKHAGIGAFRDGFARLPTANAREAKLRDVKRSVAWELDGVEANLAATAADGYAFVVNGKVDGHCIGDVGTQVWLGLLGAFWHPNPRTAAVVGLGTGESGGWLAEVPTVERVDVIEIEMGVVKVAELCADLNHRVLTHPKVRLVHNDAREALITTRATYDVIVSEPSNPYRAGVANLFTLEFYEAARRALKQGGVFVQWLQLYDVDRPTFQDTLATLQASFRHVEVWQSAIGDSLLLCSDSPPRFDLEVLRRRAAQYPYQDAAVAGWRVTSLEGMCSRFVAGNAAVKEFAGGGRLNTDGVNRLEYGFARSLRLESTAHLRDLWRVARRLDDDAPATARSTDAASVDAHRQVQWAVWGRGPDPDGASLRDSADRQALLEAYWAKNSQSVARRYDASVFPAAPLLEREIIALNLAWTGHDAAPEVLASLSEIAPAPAALMQAIWHLERQAPESALEAYAAAWNGFVAVPWAFGHVVDLLPEVTERLLAANPRSAAVVYELLSKPLAGQRLNHWRQNTRLRIGAKVAPALAAREMLALEPNVPWDESLLALREALYSTHLPSLRPRASADLARFRRWKTSSTFR